MKVSLNWIRYINEKYHCAAEPAPNGVDELVEKIGMQLGAVEEVIDLGKKYEGTVVVKVVSCEKHPNADKLSVCMIDDGKGKLVQVVCGAPNVKAGILAAWIPPGKTVPSTYDKEPFVLDTREIRGVVSKGMLASAKELDIGDDHTGIVELDDGKPGDDFAKTFHLDDFIIDIENKMFTHRPDLFGQLGVAREIAGIQGNKFKSPLWYKDSATIEKSRASDNRSIIFKNSVPKLVPRFSIVVIKDVLVKESPLFIKARLASVGIRAINNIVDLTNFNMLETSQPLHAYDYDKVSAVQNNKTNGVKMGVRLSKKGEDLTLLGGKKLQLDDGVVLVTADDKPLGLGGVMGGTDTEVDTDTKNIILESANFDMNITRRTAMHYGLFTDAATRYTKGQSALQTMTVLSKTADDIRKIAGGRVSNVIDDKHTLKQYAVVKLSKEFINNRLGEKLKIDEMKKMLENVEFHVNENGDNLEIVPPFWRTDIEIPEDIVEEIGRLYGYSHLLQQLPKRDLEPQQINKELALKTKIREMLSAAGLNEVLTYSFIHGKLLDVAGQDRSQAYKITNALSPDLQYYRLSLTPSLLEKIHPNIKVGYDFFGLFEFGIAHTKTEADKEGLPLEFNRLSVVLAGNDRQVHSNTSGAPFFWARKYLEYIFENLSLEVQVVPLKSELIKKKIDENMVKPFDQDRSAAILYNDNLIGLTGEFNTRIKQELKLPDYCAGIEINLESLQAENKSYMPISRFPSLNQDICLRLSNKISYAEATNFIFNFFDSIGKERELVGGVEPIDIYQKKTDKNHKQITWRLSLSSPQRTLTTAEVNKLMDELAAKAKESLDAERI